MLKKLLFVTIALFQLSVLRIEAQDKQPDDTLEFEMQPIEIRATHATISPEEATRSIIQKSRSLNELNSSASMTLDKLTHDMPGVWINNRHNYAFGQRMLIRGLGWRAAFGIRGIQVILDGIPLTTADGQTVTDLLDPAFIRHIEVPGDDQRRGRLVEEVHQGGVHAMQEALELLGVLCDVVGLRGLVGGPDADPEAGLAERLEGVLVGHVVADVDRQHVGGREVERVEEPVDAILGLEVDVPVRQDVL